MFIRRNTDKILIAIVAVILFIAVGYRPEYHLKSTMPPGFYREGSDSRPSSIDRRIAWAYWEAAEMDIQYRWGYAHSLPLEPPPEFHINATALQPEASDPAIRLMYWRRLQQVWPLPETWNKKYSWQADWLSHPLTSIAEWIKDTTNRLF